MDIVKCNEKRPPIYKVIGFSVFVLMLFWGGFVFWAANAELDTATIAQGKIIVKSFHKKIQHLEGGIVKKIHVREGQRVKKNAILITMEDAQARGKLTLLRSHMNEFLATESRLKAERDNLSEIKWDKRLLRQKNNSQVEQIKVSQSNIFHANRKSLEGQGIILHQRIKQLEREIESFESQVKSENQQLIYIREEVKAVRYLEAKKLIAKTRLFALQREEAKLIGNRGEHLGLIERTRQRIGETRQQLLTLRDNYQKELLMQLNETHVKLSDVSEREKAAKDILKRSVIKAPLAGTIVGLRMHTRGGVISSGETLMDIVPSQDELLVEAKISPLDIDMVHQGLQAKLRLVALKQRYTPSLNGTVVHVSADAMQDQKSHESYFIAWIAISKSELARVKSLKLYPGMPVEAMIIVDKRTMMAYLVAPIREAFERSFHEA